MGAKNAVSAASLFRSTKTSKVVTRVSMQSSVACRTAEKC